MKRASLPAVVLLLPALGFAAELPGGPQPGAAPSSPAETTARQALNRSIAAMTAAFEKTEQCFALESSLSADLAKKKAELAAEFKGKIPVVFDDLLWQKTQRIARQHAACFQQHVALGKRFEELANDFGSIEPKSLNVKKQRETVDAQKEKFLLMVPTAKPYNKSAKPRQGRQ